MFYFLSFLAVYRLVEVLRAAAAAPEQWLAIGTICID